MSMYVHMYIMYIWGLENIYTKDITTGQKGLGRPLTSNRVKESNPYQKSTQTLELYIMYSYEILKGNMSIISIMRLNKKFVYKPGIKHPKYSQNIMMYDIGLVLI